LFYLERLFKFEYRAMIPTVVIALLDGWVREAVARHGDNWPAIMAALEENFETLADGQRAELSSQISLLLASGNCVADSDFN
jgi:hypothetical protein